jgi:cell division transport system permease protein
MQQKGIVTNKKGQTSYISTIWSTALVLIILGMMCVLFFEAKNLSKSLKESITMQVELGGDADPNAYLAKRDALKNQPFIKHIEFVSKDRAAKQMQEEMGEKFIDILGYNPLFNSFNINIKAEYTDPKKLEQIKKELLKDDLIKDVVYPNDIATSLNQNINKISWISLGIILILIIVVVLLIDNTIRLAMYSDRFLVKSMQLVGATKWYIIKPYIIRSMLNGVISTLFSTMVLMGIIMFVSSVIDGLTIIHNVPQLLMIFAGLMVIGLLISSLSTYMAVKKYLNYKLDELY